MGGPMRMNPPRGMGGMGPQVGTALFLLIYPLVVVKQSKSNATGPRLSEEPCYSSLLTCAESRVLLASLSLPVLLVLGKRGAAQIGSWCSICSTNWVERRTKARVRKKQPQARKALSHFALHPRAARQVGRRLPEQNFVSIVSIASQPVWLDSHRYGRQWMKGSNSYTVPLLNHQHHSERKKCFPPNCDLVL